jgi:hypothetical protein
MSRNTIVTLGVVIVGLFLGKYAITHLVLDDARARAAELEKRPYIERDLCGEYGIRPDHSSGGGGPLGHVGRASRAHKINNALESEASRIQIEFEEEVGVLGALLVRIDAPRIAHRRFEDQHLLPKKGR